MAKSNPVTQTKSTTAPHKDVSPRNGHALVTKRGVRTVDHSAPSSKRSSEVSRGKIRTVANTTSTH